MTPLFSEQFDEEVAGPISDLGLIGEAADTLDKNSDSHHSGEAGQIASQFRLQRSQPVENALSCSGLCGRKIDIDWDGADRGEFSVSKRQLS